MDYIGRKAIIPIAEHQMEKNMEDDMKTGVLERSHGDAGFPNNFRVYLENEELSNLGFTKRGLQFTETPILPFFFEGCFNSFCERPRLKPRQDACQLIGA